MLDLLSGIWLSCIYRRTGAACFSILKKIDYAIKLCIYRYYSNSFTYIEKYCKIKKDFNCIRGNAYACLQYRGDYMSP
jgi:hypothetical protein